MFIAPSLNVVLLLVFYIVLSTSFLLQPGVMVSVPDSPFLLAPQRDPLIVSIVAVPPGTLAAHVRRVVCVFSPRRAQVFGMVKPPVSA